VWSFRRNCHVPIVANGANDVNMLTNSNDALDSRWKGPDGIRCRLPPPFRLIKRSDTGGEFAAAPTTGGKSGAMWPPKIPYPARFRRDPVGTLSEPRIRHQCLVIWPGDRASGMRSRCWPGARSRFDLSGVSPWTGVCRAVIGLAALAPGRIVSRQRRRKNSHIGAIHPG